MENNYTTKLQLQMWNQADKVNNRFSKPDKLFNKLDSIDIFKAYES